MGKEAFQKSGHALPMVQAFKKKEYYFINFSIALKL